LSQARIGVVRDKAHLVFTHHRYFCIKIFSDPAGGVVIGVTP
jgi:hypothetical protein